MKYKHLAAFFALCLSVTLNTAPAFATEAVQESPDAGEALAADGSSDSVAEQTETPKEEVTEEKTPEEEVPAEETTEEAAPEEEAPEEETPAGEKAPEEEALIEEEAPEEEAPEEDAPVEEAAEEEAAVEVSATEETISEEAASAGSSAQSSNEAASALSTLATTAGEKIAQMKLEVIDFLDEGFGDSQMLSSGDNRLLIDTYVSYSWDVLNDWLNSHQYTDFDIYISHYHDDHIGNVTNILNDGKYKVSKLYLPDYGYMTGSSTYMQNYISMCDYMMSTARNKGVEIVYLGKGSTFNVGDVTANVRISKKKRNMSCWMQTWTWLRIYANSTIMEAIPATDMISYMLSTLLSITTITAKIRQRRILLRVHGLTTRHRPRRSSETWQVSAITGISHTTSMTM